jgi:CHAD domain-containing protein
MSTSDLPADVEPSARSVPKSAWRKARLPSLTPSSTAEEALADIVLGGVEHLRGNERCVLARSHEEGIHQMRVAVRRLRSCIALYQRFIPEEQRIYMNGELKWLIGELGPARDWDVFAGEMMAPVVRQLPNEERVESLSRHVERHRDDAYTRAQAAVGAQRYIGLVLLLSSWAEGRGWREVGESDTTAAIGVKASEIAHHLLHDTYERMLAAGAGFEQLNSDERHKVRIQLKQLRYATEFFSTLYAKRKVTPYLTAMKSLQDQLGTNNDVDVARKLLKRVIKGTRGKERSNLAYAAGLVVGWHSQVGDGREKGVIDAWQRLVARAPYWEPLTATPSVTAASGAAHTEPVTAQPQAAALGTTEATAEKPNIVAKPVPARRRIVRRT